MNNGMCPLCQTIESRDSTVMKTARIMDRKLAEIGELFQILSSKFNELCAVGDVPESLREIAGLTHVVFSLPGVYFLVRAGVIVYVGKSKAPTLRLGQHYADPDMVFDSAYVLPTAQPLLIEEEAKYIRQFMPEYNRHIPGRGTHNCQGE